MRLFPLLLSIALPASAGPLPATTPAAPAPASTARPAPEATGRQAARRTTADSMAIALEQSDCPLTLSPIDLVHDDRGSTVRLRVLNEGRAPVTRYTLSVWVVLPDGTLKGSQRFDQKQAIADGAERQVPLTLRTVRVLPTDTVVVAVVDTQGDAWKGDQKALEAEARAAVKR